MKKVGILTINDYNNYGNRLQNYAVQEIIKYCGCTAETIENREGYYNKNYKVLLKSNIKNLVKKYSPKFNHKRSTKFLEFNKNINMSSTMIDLNHIDKTLKKTYQYFITGSDQVWNPNFERLTDIDLLNFADNAQKISFSASFSIDRLPEDKKEYVKKNLQTFKAISVREDAGKKIVEDLTGRTDVEVLVDPTMLLNEEEWNKVAKKPKQLKTNKYILNYFLGNLSENRRREIDKIAKENGCEVINILDKSNPIYCTGPSEFLWLEKNAFLICTDSFHSSVFAILYNKPFVVFEREDNVQSMNSRLETLLTKFNLKNRKYNGKEITKENINCDYTEAYKILEEEKKKAINFLRKALDIKN